jgi:hypothetical protein
MSFFFRRNDKSAPVDAPVTGSQASSKKPVNEPLQMELSDLVARFKALIDDAEASAKGGSGKAKHNAALIAEMSTRLGKVAGSLRSLSSQCAQAAAQVDPDALTRILDRMDSLGDATLRQIEGRIGTASSRKDRKRIQELRDEMRAWLLARDEYLYQAQTAADDIGGHANALRDELLVKADRLTKAAEMASWVAGNPGLDADGGANRHASAEAADFSASLRNLLAKAQVTPRD